MRRVLGRRRLSSLALLPGAGVRAPAWGSPDLWRPAGLVHAVLGHVDGDRRHQRSAGRHQSREGHVLRLSSEPRLRRLVRVLLRRLPRRGRAIHQAGSSCCTSDTRTTTHWNFADNGWAVHGHAKQYIAYYNWTFGGQCGLGRYGIHLGAAVHGRPVRMAGGRHLRRRGAAVRPGATRDVGDARRR